MKNYPLSKDKLDGPQDYLYRGVKVRVTRTYSFNNDYIVQSYYDVEDMAIFATSPKELKKRVDRKLERISQEVA